MDHTETFLIKGQLNDSFSKDSAMSVRKPRLVEKRHSACLHPRDGAFRHAPAEQRHTTSHAAESSTEWNSLRSCATIVADETASPIPRTVFGPQSRYRLTFFQEKSHGEAREESKIDSPDKALGTADEACGKHKQTTGEPKRRATETELRCRWSYDARLLHRRRESRRVLFEQSGQ